MCNITRNKYPEVQTLVREYRDAERKAEEEKKMSQRLEETEKEKEVRFLRKQNMQLLQWELIQAAERLYEYDPEEYLQLPFVKEPHVYRLQWYKPDSTELLDLSGK